MTMGTTTHQPSSLGTYFVHLFEVDADRFQLPAKPTCDRDGEYLNRPYEMSELMRQTTVAVVWRR